MKYVWFALITIALGIAVWWVSVLYVTPPRDPGPASIVFPPIIDLGDWELGATAVAAFSVANQGDSTLELDQFGSSCSCAGIEREIDGRHVTIARLSIPPHSEIRLFARVAVRGAPGTSSRSIAWFRTNDPARPRATLTIEIPRILGVQFTPDPVLFNNASLGKEISRIVELRNIGTGSPELISTTSDSPDSFQATLLPPPEGTSKDSLNLARVKVTLNTHKPGNIGGDLLVTLRWGSHTKVLKVRVSANIAPPITVSPSEVSLPRESGTGQVTEFTSAVRATDGAPISVRAKEIPHGFSVTVIDDGAPTPVKMVRVQWDLNSSVTLGGQNPSRHVIKLDVRHGESIYMEQIQINCARGASKP